MYVLYIYESCYFIDNSCRSDLQSAFIENGILTMLAVRAVSSPHTITPPPPSQEWLTPLPDHSLPHAKIRESLLDLLRTVSTTLKQNPASPLTPHPSPLPPPPSPLTPPPQYPLVDSSLLKESKVGKAVMLLYRHPKESRKNKEKAGKLISQSLCSAAVYMC